MDMDMDVDMDMDMDMDMEHGHGHGHGHGDHTDKFEASVSVHRILAGTTVVVWLLEGKSCQQGCHTKAHKPSECRAIR
eukprot:4751980-Prymnesium_polylepis.1